MNNIVTCVFSCSIYEKEIATKVIKWCIEHFNLNCYSIRLEIKPYEDCCGSCTEGEKEHSYVIFVASDQPLRDFVATIVHEMIHVNQWETGKWEGDGEKEAEKLQYKLTDVLWKENVL
jgi:uncharacterized protein YjaZ